VSGESESVSVSVAVAVSVSESWNASLASLDGVLNNRRSVVI